MLQRKPKQYKRRKRETEYWKQDIQGRPLRGGGALEADIWMKRESTDSGDDLGKWCPEG